MNQRSWQEWHQKLRNQHSSSRNPISQRRLTRPQFVVRLHKLSIVCWSASEPTPNKQNIRPIMKLHQEVQNIFDLLISYLSFNIDQLSCKVILKRMSLPFSEIKDSKGTNSSLKRSAEESLTSTVRTYCTSHLIMKWWLNFWASADVVSWKLLPKGLAKLFVKLPRS